MILRDESFIRDLLKGTNAKVDSEIWKLMIPELEEKVMHLVQEAKKVMRHSKRRILKPLDIELALKQIERSTINRVIGTGTYEYEKKVTEENSKWVLKNEDINLMQFLNKPITETPLKISLEMHWALINGEVPLIAENIMPPKEKMNLQKKNPDPLKTILKPKDTVSKKKMRLEHKKEISISQEVMEFYNKFLEIYQTEESDTLQSLGQWVTLAISPTLKNYIFLVEKEPSIVDIVPAIFDFILQKWVNYISNKVIGDAKMMYIWMKIAKHILANKYYNWEEKIHLFVELLYDTLIRVEYHEESLSKAQEIILEAKNLSALALNIIIIEYGTKYQSITKSIFDSVKAEVQKDKASYLLLYGPLVFISLQDIYHSNDWAFYTNMVRRLLENSEGVDFKEPCLQVVKKIIKNVYNFYDLNPNNEEIKKEARDDLFKLISEYFPDIVHLRDVSLEYF